MLDDDQIQELNNKIMDRFSIEDVCEILELTTLDILHMYQDSVLDVNWDELF